MKLSQLDNYIRKAQNDGLVEIQVKLALDAETTSTDFDVVKTKEVYNYGDEHSADVKIDEVRELNGFVGVKKKFKAGKWNKAGEELRPDIWSITVEIEW